MFVFLFYIELCERELGESKEYRRFLTTEGQEKGLHYNLWVSKLKKKKKKKKRISTIIYLYQSASKGFLERTARNVIKTLK